MVESSKAEWEKFVEHGDDFDLACCRKHMKFLTDRVLNGSVRSS